MSAPAKIIAIPMSTHDTIRLAKARMLDARRAQNAASEGQFAAANDAEFEASKQFWALINAATGLDESGMWEAL